MRVGYSIPLHEHPTVKGSHDKIAVWKPYCRSGSYLFSITHASLNDETVANIGCRGHFHGEWRKDSVIIQVVRKKLIQLPI